MMDNYSSLFFEYSSKLLKQLGKKPFYKEVGEFLGGLIGCDIQRVVCYSRNNKPEFITSNAPKKETEHLYIERLNQLYSLFNIMRASMIDEVMMLSQMEIKKFHNIYSDHAFFRDNIKDDEAAIIMVGTAELTIIYTLSCSNEIYLNESISIIRDALPFILEMHRHHFSLCGCYAKNSSTIVHSLNNDVSSLAENRLTNVLYSFSKQYKVTPRESEIISYVLRGYPNCLIANKLTLSIGTIKNHRHRLYYKLDITSERELFSMFLSYLLRIEIKSPEHLSY